MAKKERQRRSARQARSQERERMAADAASDEATTSSTKAVQSSLQPSRKHSKSDAKKANGGRIKAYFKAVKTEMHRVVWPSKPELKNYSGAVICALVVCGLAIWLVDTGFVALLVSFTGLRG